ncbi:MAG: nicotinate (nicotinamide) nucleotide adenylyltransferase [Microgenomates group bacterium]
MKNLILVLGSAFDPPHNGHMTMASEVVRCGIAQKVIFVPCGNHAFLKEMGESRYRYDMTKIVVDKLVVQNGPYFELSDTEILRSGQSYAWDTMEELAKKYSDGQIGWLMGSDQLPNFNKWYKYRDILAKYPIYVYPRKGYTFELMYPGMIRVEGVPVVEVSSSGVRRAMAEKGDIAGMVLPDVAKYIQENSLWIK